MRTAFTLVLCLLSQESQVHEVRDLQYWDGAAADSVKHRLDLYMPKGAKNVPILMFIHGGGWMIGNRSEVSDIGRRIAESSIGFAAINYRLSPEVKHPVHAEDCARAFAWLQAHAAEYGGDPKRLFIAGYSAGGHLAALLTLDPSYLRALKVPEGAIKGTVSLSGIYSIPPLPPKTTGPSAMFPIAFGSDPEVCKGASPISHIAALSVPMLVITETEDAVEVSRETERFRLAAEKAGAKHLRFLDAEHRDHASLLTALGRPEEDPVRAAVIQFIRQRCTELDSVK